MFNCLSAIIMIMFNSTNVNTNFKKNVQNYLNITNFGPLECPYCHSYDYILWGHYERNVIFFSSDNTTLTSMVLSVQRVKCKSCGKTHALLPFGIIPYKQFTDEVITKIINELFNSNIDELSKKHLIDITVIKNWMFDLKKKHLPRITTLMRTSNKKTALINFFINPKYKELYLINYNRCFMQNKLGWINLAPPSREAPT